MSTRITPTARVRGFGAGSLSRHFDDLTAQWTAKDSFWPKQLPYSYLAGNPATFDDASGQGQPYDVLLMFQQSWDYNVSVYCLTSNNDTVPGSTANWQWHWENPSRTPTCAQSMYPQFDPVIVKWDGKCSDNLTFNYISMYTGPGDGYSWYSAIDAGCKGDCSFGGPRLSPEQLIVAILKSLPFGSDIADAFEAISFQTGGNFGPYSPPPIAGRPWGPAKACKGNNWGFTGQTVTLSKCYTCHMT